MTTKQFVAQPSVRHELDRLQKLGGTVTVGPESLFLDPGAMPVSVAMAFAVRIQKLDTSKTLRVTLNERGAER